MGRAGSPPKFLNLALCDGRRARSQKVRAIVCGGELSLAPSPDRPELKCGWTPSYSLLSKHGGRKKRDAQAALIPLAEAGAQNQVLCSSQLLIVCSLRER